MKLGNWLAHTIIEEEIADFVSTGIVTSLLENNFTGGSEVDDGPTTFYKSKESYKASTKKQTQDMGMQVLDYILGEHPLDSSYTNTNMPTYFQAGLPGEETATNKDYKFTKAYSLWKKHINKIALLVGWEFVDFLTKKDIPSKTPSNDKIKEPSKASSNPLTEAVRNEHAFKAIFLAGGPGSGKSTVINALFGIPPKNKIQSGLTKAGLKIVNSDSAYEYLKSKHSIPPSENDMSDEERSQAGKLMAKSVKIAKKQLSNYLDGKLGIIIDGTGASSNALGKKKKRIEDLGYDCYMIFVSTSLETAMERNQKRKERTLLDKVVERSWQAVMDNLKTYKSMFSSNFSEVSTEGEAGKNLPPGVISSVNKFLRKPPKNKIAIKYLKHAKELL
tara:strand:+ start:6814 stop:7980 length:1167 start_codon:yes stop_codon:yes gene_type:complete